MTQGQWGKTLWGTGPANLAGNPNVLDVMNSYLDVLYRLGYAGLNDITPSSWVTPGELFTFAEDAAKKVAYQAGVMITTDASVTVVANTAIYGLPTAHVFTLQAALGATLLRINTVRDLWALDGTWQATSGPAARASFDAGSVGTITLYPNPTTGGTLNQVCQMYAGTVAPGASTLPLSTILQDYFSYAMLAGARGKESESAMPEMAKHYQARCDLYEQMMQQYWGSGQ